VATDADVYYSKCYDSWIEHSHVTRSHLERADIEHTELVLTVVENSEITNSRVYDSLIKDSQIENANVRAANIAGCKITSGWIQNATLVGVTIDQDIRVGCGTWTSTPRSFVLNDDNVKNIVVTESTDGYAYVGCTKRPMLHWIKGKARYQKVMGWTNEMMDLIEANFRTWLEN
jgi:uncharacterized protein YjbI with pentapeptide repeats